MKQHDYVVMLVSKFYRFHGCSNQSLSWNFRRDIRVYLCSWEQVTPYLSKFIYFSFVRLNLSACVNISSQIHPNMFKSCSSVQKMIKYFCFLSGQGFKRHFSFTDFFFNCFYLGDNLILFGSIRYCK